MTAAGTVAAGQQRLRAPTTPAGVAPSRWRLFCLVSIVLVLVAVRFVWFVDDDGRALFFG